MLEFFANIHLLWSVLFVFSLIMVFVGGLVSHLEKYLPNFVGEAFRYGKTVKNQRTSNVVVRSLEVKKSRFLDFYIFGSIITTFLTITCIRAYLLEIEVPAYLTKLLDVSCTARRSGNANSESILLATILLTLQCYRRLYECLFVNVESGSRMNILHYIVGYVHYFSASMGIFCEAPGFVPPEVLRPDHDVIHWVIVTVDLQKISWQQYAATFVFLWAWYHQFIAHKIFAKLKKSNSGKHSLPMGDWFKFVSCPHYLAEVLMYLCLAIILGPRHITGIVVFIWVTINQSVAALMSHFWYKEKFDNYPKSRKAIFPFIF